VRPQPPLSFEGAMCALYRQRVQYLAPIFEERGHWFDFFVVRSVPLVSPLDPSPPKFPSSSSKLDVIGDYTALTAIGLCPSFIRPDSVPSPPPIVPLFLGPIVLFFVPLAQLSVCVRVDRAVLTTFLLNRPFLSPPLVSPRPEVKECFSLFWFLATRRPVAPSFSIMTISPPELQFFFRLRRGFTLALGEVPLQP